MNDSNFVLVYLGRCLIRFLGMVDICMEPDFVCSLSLGR
jgi:hypothetical protein